MIKKPFPALFLTKTVYVPNAMPGQPPIRKVAQRVKKGLGNVIDDPSQTLQIRAHVIPVDPKTTAQLERRTTFAAAVAEWQTMTDDEKQLWSTKASRQQISGINLWIREYIRNH
jgi:hypothetical protein